MDTGPGHREAHGHPIIISGKVGLGLSVPGRIVTFSIKTGFFRPLKA
jgi:hypothetical protein